MPIRPSQRTYSCSACCAPSRACWSRAELAQITVLPFHELACIQAQSAGLEYRVPVEIAAQGRFFREDLGTPDKLKSAPL